MDATDPSGAIVHRRFSDLPSLISPGDVVVVNETRVVPARVPAVKESGGKVEVLLLEEIRPVSPDGAEWEALVRPLRRCPPGTPLFLAGAAGCEREQGRAPVAIVGERCGDGTRARVHFAGGVDPTTLGAIALPPYITEPLGDPERYQTVFARTPGSVAAPTAGLHFTSDLVGECTRAGAHFTSVDLAVGLATFAPITASRVEDHVMHTEFYSVPDATVRACGKARRVIAVGTTTLRALESWAVSGATSGHTSLFIHGDYPFEVVDVLVTNFHMPRSTLLVLLDSFCGSRWRDIYGTALAQGYRFLSFGDAMIVGRRR